MTTKVTVDQNETERFLFNVLGHGDKSSLAHVLGVSLSEISQQVNPEETRKSDYFKFKRFLSALVTVNPKAAQLLCADLQSVIDAQSSSKDISRLTGDVAHQSTELICAALENKPLHVQRKEALDVVVAGYQFIAGLERKPNEVSAHRPVARRLRRTG